MRIEIHSRKSLLRRASAPLPPRTALISICDPDDVHPSPANLPAHHLRLSFDDISPELFCSRLSLPLSLREDKPAWEAALRAHSTVLFTPTMAQTLADFLARVLPQTAVLMCQCEYGQSRSAAVAAAVLSYRGKDPGVIFDDIRYCPNTYVYETLLGALRAGSPELRLKGGSV